MGIKDRIEKLERHTGANKPERGSLIGMRTISSLLKTLPLLK